MCSNFQMSDFQNGNSTSYTCSEAVFANAMAIVQIFWLTDGQAGQTDGQ